MPFTVTPGIYYRYRNCDLTFTFCFLGLLRENLSVSAMLGRLISALLIVAACGFSPGPAAVVRNAHVAHAAPVTMMAGWNDPYSSVKGERSKVVKGVGKESDFDREMREVRVPRSSFGTPALMAYRMPRVPTLLADRREKQQGAHNRLCRHCRSHWCLVPAGVPQVG